MKTYNVTAQVYHKKDIYKQTILMNEIVSASSQENAKNIFQQVFETDYVIINIYSAEPFDN